MKRAKRVAIGATIIIAVGISCLGIVRVQRLVEPAGGVSYKCNTGTACVEGDSTGNPSGVEGRSTHSNGVFGLTSSTTGDSGVAGESNGKSGTAYGVFGSSSNGPGVYGLEANYDGVEGVSSDADGVYGSSSRSFGVYGEDGTSATVGQAGVEGVDNGTGAGTRGESTTGIAVEARIKSNNAVIFDGLGVGPLTFCQIDADADLYCSGKITSGKASQAAHRTSSGRHVLAYAAESTSSTIEDFGTARMSRGVANVQIEPTFASTIDRNGSYYVFLTPLGDTRGLFVSLKTPASFQVRETEGGHSNLAFDYRIVAHPADASNGRLPQAPAMKRR